MKILVINHTSYYPNNYSQDIPKFLGNDVVINYIKTCNLDDLKKQSLDIKLQIYDVIIFNSSIQYYNIADFLGNTMTFVYPYLKKLYFSDECTNYLKDVYGDRLGMKEACNQMREAASKIKSNIIENNNLNLKLLLIK